MTLSSSWVIVSASGNAELGFAAHWLQTHLAAPPLSLHLAHVPTAKLPASQFFYLGVPSEDAKLAALLELPSSTVADAFVYTSARDILSAAVRLNLIGPLAAVALQDEIVSDCAAAEWQLSSCDKAAGAAPLLEAAHACHDLLERRVFNS